MFFSSTHIQCVDHKGWIVRIGDLFRFIFVGDVLSLKEG